jgi:signal transduction histidine kinase
VAAYSPVAFSGIHAWSVLITTPSSHSETFASVLSDQRIFTIVAIILIGIIAAIFMAFILTLNHRLHRTVQKQDQQIKGQLDDLQNAYERLTEQDKIKDEFINIAAHELRTPVLPIILSAEGLSEDIGTDNNKIEIILRNAKRINKLTNDILDVSRIKSNTFRLQKDRISVKKLIEESIQDVLFKMAENKNPNLKIAFESRLPEGNDEIVADRGRLNQVLANLLDNAVNFTDQGMITVTIQQAKDPGFIEVMVADTGKGIDPAIRPKLFEKFVTKSEKAKGTGLGLYLCKAIVEAHGGKIWAEDNIGKGAVFAFTLPANI